MTNKKNEVQEKTSSLESSEKNTGLGSDGDGQLLEEDYSPDPRTLSEEKESVAS
jgi:hypothetical protein